MSMNRSAAWALVATVGPIGRLPAAGTWGSGIGLLIGLAGIDVWRTPPLLLLLLVTFPLCALICTGAERHLDQRDPPSVILDEVWAMAMVLIVQARVIGGSGRMVFLAFLLFRLFDILEPIPLKRLALLPRGWGIMAYDHGAAAYTCAILWDIHQFRNC